MTSAISRTKAALAKIADPAGQGAKTFLKTYADQALAAAAAADARAKSGNRLSALDGKIVSIKDLFDVTGEPTTAGTTVYQTAPSATADADIVARLRAAGAIIIGKTNMTELARSGLGLNPHYGTPGNPHDRTRIPGGSSSGAAVALGDGMCELSIGSDTGGSVRIPASFCGLVGFKPTQARVSRQGVAALSYSLDCIGPIARSVQEAAEADAVLSGDTHPLAPRENVSGLRIGVPNTLFLEDAEAEVVTAYATALSRLEKAGAKLMRFDMNALLQQMDAIQEKGRLSSAEAAHAHFEILTRRASEIDQRVIQRMADGFNLNAIDYIEMLHRRAAFIARGKAEMSAFDVVATPTVPMRAPNLAALEADNALFFKVNLLALRNPSVFNMLDTPSMSLPLPVEGLPIGLMLSAPNGADHALLSHAAAVERALRA